jgi:hypothetical protein
VSLDKNPRKKNPITRQKKIHLPTTHRSSPAGPAHIWIINREHLIESIKPPKKKLSKSPISTPKKHFINQKRRQSTRKPRRILNIKKIEIKGKPMENNDKDESSQNI